MRNRARLILAAVAACLLTCTAAQAQSGPGERNQRESDLPVSAWVDSAALAAALAQIPSPETQPGVPSVFSLRVNKDGKLSARPVFEGLADDYAQPLMAALLAHARSPLGEGARKAGSASFLLEPGAAPRVEIARFRSEREPQLLNGPIIGGRVQRYVDTHREGIPPGIYRVAVTGRVDREGALHAIRLVSSTGIGTLDRALVAIAAQMRFRPAALDGFPVPVSVTLPLVFERP